jgi:nucleoside-diphosphate-sugar epimerase
MKDMKIVLIGASDFVGTRLIEQLRQAGQLYLTQH